MSSTPRFLIGISLINFFGSRKYQSHSVDWENYRYERSLRFRYSQWRWDIFWHFRIQRWQHDLHDRSAGCPLSIETRSSMHSGNQKGHICDPYWLGLAKLYLYLWQGYKPSRKDLEPESLPRLLRSKTLADLRRKSHAACKRPPACLSSWCC